MQYFCTRTFSFNSYAGFKINLIIILVRFYFILEKPSIHTELEQ